MGNEVESLISISFARARLSGIASAGEPKPRNKNLVIFLALANFSASSGVARMIEIAILFVRSQRLWKISPTLTGFLTFF
jgi:hypothetical protein